MIYLDNCATTKPSSGVIKEIALAMESEYANPSSLHSFGHEIEKKIEKIRGNISTYLKAKSGEIIFTSGGTESNNMALSFLIDRNLKYGNKVITSNIEHPSVLEYLKSRKDIDLKILSVDESGRLDPKIIEENIDASVILLSLFHVNNELGTIHDLERICKMAKEFNPNIKIHIDGVQAVGKIPVNLSSILCDTYSFSGHKFHGPKGIGGLFIREKNKSNPLLFGGGQEFGLRSGTYNTLGIYGMGQAFKELSLYDEEHYNNIFSMKQYIIDYFSTHLKDIRVNSVEPSSPFMLNISIADTRGEVLLHILEQKDIFISTSSACSSHRQGENPILKAIGLDSNYSQGTIRVCLSHQSQLEEVEYFCKTLEQAINEIRSIIRRNE